MKSRILTALTVILFIGCTQQIESPSNQKSPSNKKIEMPKDCQQYFDGLKELAKDNQNLAEKFGDKLVRIDVAWQNLEDVHRKKFSEECIIRNKQLQEMKGTPELETLLNEL